MSKETWRCACGGVTVRERCPFCKLSPPQSAEVLIANAFKDGKMYAGIILRSAAETAHVNTAELLLKLAKEIEES